MTLGNGSNDLLLLLAEAFLTPSHSAVYSQYGFAIYRLVMRKTGARAIEVPALGEAATCRSATIWRPWPRRSRRTRDWYSSPILIINRYLGAASAVKRLLESLPAEHAGRGG